MGKDTVVQPSQATSELVERVDSQVSSQRPEKVSNDHFEDPVVAEVRPEPKRGWRNLIWDSLDKSPEERKLIWKLDMALLTLGCLSELSV